jgi:alcohol dehydrogenase
MKALVYHGPGQRAWEEVPDPTIQAPTDAIVRIDTATICGTDLHILKGDVPEVTPGTILGHEAVGTVVETGSAVTTLEPGDRVLVSCITSCGRCRFCKEGRYGLCTGGGGWIFGHLIDGLQAEFARVPFADTSVYKVPAELSDEQVLFLADILPTAYEVGVLNGGVEPGDTVAIVGAGPTPFATHRFALTDAEQAYDVFGAAAESHALKVVLEAAPVGHELLEQHEVPVTA